MITSHVEYLGHHWIVLAVPAFLPAIIVVGVILYIALRDRRAARNPGDNPGNVEAAAGTEAAEEKRD